MLLVAVVHLRNGMKSRSGHQNDCQDGRDKEETPIQVQGEVDPLTAQREVENTIMVATEKAMKKKCRKPSI